MRRIYWRWRRLATLWLIALFQIWIAYHLVTHPLPVEPTSSDVAWVRLSPNQSMGKQGLLFTLHDGQLTAKEFTLRMLIFEAYHLNADYELAGGSDWINTARWDLDAKATSPTDVIPMLRTLLADRFGLNVHWESREVPAARGPVQVLVIDIVQRPSDNYYLVITTIMLIVESAIVGTVALMVVSWKWLMGK